MREKVLTLIASLERQKEEYAKMIREAKTEDEKNFFGGKLAGVFDEIIDLEWILKEQ